MKGPKVLECALKGDRVNLDSSSSCSSVYCLSYSYHYSLPPLIPPSFFWTMKWKIYHAMYFLPYPLHTIFLRPKV